MSTGRYLLRRLLVAVVLTLAVSSVALLLTLSAPGDFASDLGLATDPAVVARRRADLGLDRPIAVQFAAWMGRAVRLDFGESLLYARPVSELLRDRALNTAVLATTALGLATVLGVPLGVYTGRRRRGAGAAAVRGLSLLMLSTPPLMASLLLVLLAARTGWFPVGGMVSADASHATWASWLVEMVRHVPLPALALALPLAAILERLQSQAIRDTVSRPFVQAAVARGLSRQRAELVHGWRPSLSVVLGLYGVLIASLFSGSFVVEVMTAWPGLGRLMYDALRARDLYLVAGCAAAGAVTLSAGTLVADVLRAVADPRVRLGART
jgi:peptide/nickel transport system permease protein